MKKIVLALALIVAMGFSTTAKAFSFDWGVTGGYTLTKMKLDGGADRLFESDNRSGWFVGAKANVGLFLGFGLDGALLYSQQKLNINNEGSNYYNSSETHRSFEIPINLKYSIGLGRIASIYAATGPQFDFNIGDDHWYNNKFKRENMVTSWNVGVGAKLLKHLDLGVVYNFGITKVGKTFLDEVTDHEWETTGDAKSNSFKVQLTYFF